MRYASNATLMNNTLIPAMVANSVGDTPTFPEQLTLMTNSSCNYRCRMCFQEHHKDDEVSWGVVEKIGEVLPFVDTLQINGGETFLYKRFLDLVALAGRTSTKVRLITNASLMDAKVRHSLVENQVFNIKLSLDAATAKTYKHIRGGDFLKVVNNIAELTKLKKAVGSLYPILEFNIVLMRANIRELPRILVLAQNLGIYQVNFYYMHCTKEDWAHESLWFDQGLSDDTIAKTSEIAKTLGVNVTLPKPFKGAVLQETRVSTRCEEPWRSCLVGTRGELMPCCGGASSVGSLEEKDFNQLWNGPELIHLRKTVNTPDKPDFCKNCAGRMQDERAIATHFRKDLIEKMEQGRLSHLRAAS